MTDSERKAWEELVECIKNGRGYIEHFMLDGEQATILAADAELKDAKSLAYNLDPDRTEILDAELCELVAHLGVHIEQLQEENKRLREAVEWALERARTITLLDIFSGEGVNAFIVELRRRAGMEG